MVGLAALSAQAYVRALTSSGNPLRRTDQSNIQFLIHDQAAAGLTNADGEPWITAGSDPRAALRAALDNWDRVADADLLFAPPTETSVAHLPDDGNHVFVFDDTPEIRAALGSALAIARSRFFLSGEIIDSDILFNPKNTINGQQVPFATTLEEGTFDLESVATHEVGHTLGANHTHILAASMFPRAPPASKLQAEITADDIAFAVEAYPAPGAQAAHGSISGTVTLTGGGAARGVLLTAVDPNGGIAVGTLSDFGDGTYELGPLPPGGYQVTAEPAAGTVTPLDFQPADPGGFNTNVLSDFLGGASTPQTVQVLAGLNAAADFSLDEGTPGLSIQFVGVAAPGGSLAGVSIGSAALPLTAGEAADLILAGPGIDATLSASHLRLLAPGLTIRSVGVEPGFTINGLPIIRATVDVDPRQGRDTGTLAIVKDGEVALFSGGLSIEGSEAPPPPPPQPGPEFSAAGIVNAGSFTGTAIAAEMIVSIFGTDLATGLRVAKTLPLPEELSGTIVEVTDSLGTTRRALLFFVSAGQVNCLIPEFTALGTATIVIRSEDRASAPIQIEVQAVSPGLFAANADGQGVAAAGAVHVDNQGVQTPVDVFNAGANPRTAIPIDLGDEGEIVVLLLFGTGIRGQSSTEVTIGGERARLFGVAVQPEFEGLDQINAGIPRSLIGRGDVNVETTVDGIQLNTLTINIE